jgi:7,8-dihydropterin-6-yl-methyl-4-(beta-D-ribofuranosyl)aminobenzene 5'-phosphate synthase
MRVTVLIENDRLEGRDDLTAEFGLSLLVEHGSSTILFDTGTTGTFADNAAALGIDLARVDAAVVSHHHFDHGGGLKRFFAVNATAPVYLRHADRANRVFKLLGVVKRPIGIDLGLFERFSERIVEIETTTEIVPGVFLLTDMGAGHMRPRGNRHLRVETDRGTPPDPFDHELTMVVHEADGMAIFTGCSHNGVLNMVDAAIAAFPDLPVKTVIGGFHLVGLLFFNSMAASRGEVEGIARALGERCSGPVVTGHCTGKKAYGVLAAVLGERLRTFPTGTVLEV